MWELAGIATILLLLILIFVVVACWISLNNQCRKCRRHLELLERRTDTGIASLRSEQTILGARSFLQCSSSATVSRAEGRAHLVHWNEDPTLESQGWRPIYSTIDQAKIGWTVPLRGTYRVQLIGEILFMIVNGQPLQRSLNSKNFLIHLERGDALSFFVHDHSNEDYHFSAELLDPRGLSADKAGDAFPAQKDVHDVEQWIEKNAASFALDTPALLTTLKNV